MDSLQLRQLNGLALFTEMIATPNLKMASQVSIHTCSLAAPMQLEEARAAGVRPTPKEAGRPRRIATS
jgi:hypothetical protein